jgi:hypothetical protein
MAMMISVWWLGFAFALGTYLGMIVYASLIMSSHEPRQTDAGQLGDDPTLARIATDWRTEETVIRPHSGIPAI